MIEDKMRSLQLFSKLNPGHGILYTIYKNNFFFLILLHVLASEESMPLKSLGDRAGVKRMIEGERRGKAWNGEKVQWVLLSQSAYFLGCGQHTPFQF